MIDGPPPEQTTSWRRPSRIIRRLAGEAGELARLLIIMGLARASRSAMCALVSVRAASTMASALPGSGMRADP